MRGFVAIPTFGFVGGTLARLASSRFGLPVRELVAPISVGGALLLMDATSAAFPGGGAFLLLLVPVVLSAIVLGRTGGSVALASGALGALFLVPVRGHPWLTETTDLALLGLYLGVGAAVILAGSALPGEGRGSMPGAVLSAAADGRTLPVEPLTPREIEILRLAAQGWSVDQIGRRLYLSRNTVKSHLSHAYGKLGAHNRAQAIAAGLGAGLLDANALAPATDGGG